MRLAPRSTIILTSIFCAGSSAHAQPSGPAGPSPFYAGASEELARDPSNVELLFRIAQRAEEDAARHPENEEDLLRLAIRHYERILLVNPDVPQAALRLGELQYRFGRYTEAQAHFERSLADPSLPPEIRAEAERYLAAIRENLRPSRLAGSLFAGLRHQTNATAGPAEEVPEFGDLVSEDPGTDVFFALRLIHAYDPGWQRRHLVETRLDLEGSHFLDQDDLDTQGADLAFGPRLDLSSFGAGAVSLYPHLFGSLLAVDGALFVTEAGLGVEAEGPLTPDLWGQARLSGVSQSYNETAGNPDLDDRDGWEYSGRLSAEYRLTPAFALGGSLQGIYKQAEIATEEFRRLGAELSASLAHGAPVGPGEASWVTRLALGWSEARYGILPGENRRRDEYLWLRLSSELPVARSVSLAASLGYTDRRSDLPEFEYDNIEVALGIAYRF